METPEGELLWGTIGAEVRLRANGEVWEWASAGFSICCWTRSDGDRTNAERHVGDEGEEARQVVIQVTDTT